MRTKTYNPIDNDALLNAVKTAVSEEALRCAAITAVYTKNRGNDWRFLIGKCEFSSDLAEVEEIYYDSAFVRKCVTNFELDDFLVSLNGNGYNISGNLPPLVSTGENSITWTEELVASNVTMSKSPERKYLAETSRETSFLEGILLGYDSGFRPSAREYVQKFMNLEVYHGQSHGDNGVFSISIPDFRGKIVFDEEVLSIEGLLEEVCLVGRVPGLGLIKIFKGETLEVSMSSINQSELWLLTKENEILDYRSVIEGGGSILSGDSDLEKSERILALIERGEGHETEFKQYIELSDGKNSKADEVEKTVCALSNGKGGYFLIGVKDDARVIGVDEKVREHYKLRINEALEKYEKDITKRLREKLRYSQCFNVSHVKIGSRHVVIVMVERTKKPNYFLNSDLAYIRKGATSAKMKSTDEREQDSSFFSSF